MKATMLYGPGDVRVENRPDLIILNPTDAIIRIAAACVCGSDLWDYRGINPVSKPKPLGHEYCGTVEEIGVGVPHDVALDGTELFHANVHPHGGPAPGRAFLPDLIDRTWSGTIKPGQVFDLTLPLDRAADGYRAMDERTAIKAMLQPGPQPIGAHERTS